MRCELLDEIFGLGGGKLFIKGDDQKVGHAEVANQRDFMLRRGKQMRRVLRPQHFHRMWIEGHNDRGSILRLSVACGSGNNRLMAAMDAIENTDREKKRAGQVR